MFDVNTPESMQSLKKWWADFCDKAPLADGDMHDYCCVVVGNKIDMAGKGKGLVSESEALEFLDDLVPPQESIDILPPSVSDGSPELPFKVPFIEASSHLIPSSSIAIPSAGKQVRTDVGSVSPKHQLFKSRSRSSSRFYAGTMTTTHTTLTIYHTPSSSLFDVYQSARASPEPGSAPEHARARSPSPPARLMARQRTLTMLSTGSTSSGSAPTITPSLVAREREAVAAAAAERAHLVDGFGDGASGSPQVSPVDVPFGMLPLPPERGPRLFFTSAKTGEGVADVFEYIARRVVQKWEYDEWVEARTMHFRDASANMSTIRLDGERWNRKKLGKCCSS